MVRNSQQGDGNKSDGDHNNKEARDGFDGNASKKTGKSNIKLREYKEPEGDE